MKWTYDASPCVVPSLLMCCALAFSGSAFSVDVLGKGRVSMEGAIVETPCAIEVGDHDQSLVMDTLPVSLLIREGRGPERQFSIRLMNCVLSRVDATVPVWQRFQVTFDGDNDHGHFGVSGEARGVALMIRDARGEMAAPGEAMPAIAITPGERQLHYTLNLVGNQQTLRAGDYRTAIRFRMDYY
ncbi:type 1 fimbrial protein [Serratia fonticola]|uniref:fimbrial protein n=1 Tax=Serratia fonticola TaxID=47917 RepID=UPI0015C5AEE5|nr:fimbrial protein [Serratia fonticola]MBC3378723.1 type 1 fimbrial protein [Serratia fonticola]NYA37923.1 type 1 fimbrial protein [Serratia fonticola]